MNLNLPVGDISYSTTPGELISIQLAACHTVHRCIDEDNINLEDTLEDTVLVTNHDDSAINVTNPNMKTLIVVGDLITDVNILSDCPLLSNVIIISLTAAADIRFMGMTARDPHYIYYRSSKGNGLVLSSIHLDTSNVEDAYFFGYKDNELQVLPYVEAPRYNEDLFNINHH